MRLHLHISVYAYSLRLQILIIQPGRCGQVCGIPASYWRNAGFKSRPEGQYTDLIFRGLPQFIQQNTEIELQIKPLTFPSVS
jgi:hypothetical protein